MEKKAKKSIRLNLFDILVVCIILIIAVGVYFISHRDTDTEKEMTEVVYTVEISKLPEGTSQYLEIGQEMKDNKHSCPAGTITDIEVRPYVTKATDQENGTIQDQAVSGYETVLITLKADCAVSDHNISLDDQNALRVGVGISYSTGSFSGSGYVVGIER